MLQQNKSKVPVFDASRFADLDLDPGAWPANGTRSQQSAEREESLAETAVGRN